MNEESILESLFWMNNEQHPIKSDDIKNGFEKLRNTLGWLESNEQERIYEIVYDLCVYHSVVSFTEGVRFGALLMLEIQK